MQSWPIGLGFWAGWLWVTFLNGPFLYKLLLTTDSYQINIVMLLFLFLNAITYLVLANEDYLKKFNNNSIIFCGMILMVCSTLLIVGVAFSTVLSLYTLYLAAILGGIGSAIILIFYGDLYSQYSIKHAGLYYGICLAIATLVYLGISFIHLNLAILITSLLPLFATYYLIKGMSNTNINKIVDNEDYTKLGKISFIRLAIMFFLFYFVGGLMYNILSLLPNLPKQQLFWYSSIIYCVVIFIAVVSIFKDEFTYLRYSHNLALPLLGIGFLLVPFLSGGSILISFLFFQMGFAVFDFFVWMILCYIAKTTANKRQVFAFGFFIITLSMFGSSFFHQGITLYVTNVIQQINTLSILAAILMFVSAPLFTNLFSIVNTNQDSSDDIISLAESGATSDNIADPTNVFSEYGLTAREHEVLDLLLKGYNNPNICNSLNISNNTVKTHLRNIYRKVEVSNRQELINIYYSQKRI
ncbi:hypothetical protein SYNTR_1684 [Candidatus Syntrophocurvum alkaliphilum]|uniref:HTH luxR-type domain-containing protein n=1 Tax=Candidatus Syntrophocurvum alkaliphilum TaxID=2293317 RepID=A0A6I6DCE9_9FIRM|nr:helix-turn-helix transcriptional regulator [Candidatus Syntrophocurvum alkaliphilum]QGU00278.1 hypothetical protein SYNTR_1684 [Candidatus Syntrophocurvum alkaliphilum]